MESRNVTPIDDAARHQAARPYSFRDLFIRPDLMQHPAPNTVLFHEGEAPTGVYILHSGEVDLVHENAEGAERGRTARAGEILGLSAVISGRSHLETALTRTQCDIGFIDRKEFRCIVDDNPAIWFNVLRQLSQDVNQSYDVIRRELTKRSH